MNIVFDFGAVLFTWQPAQLVAIAFPQTASNPEAAKQLAHAIFSHDDWHGFDRGTVEMAEVIRRTALRLDLPESQLDALVSHIGERLTPIEETVSVLSQLVQQRSRQNSLRLYYLSNMPVPYARVLEQRHAFLTWFDGGIFSGDVKHIKPDPAIYELLENRYALDPVQTVFIDDLKTNVAAAQARGWRGIHFESAGQLAIDLGIYVA
jgi:putative hydrolase of the HAD superfamily